MKIVLPQNIFSAIYSVLLPDEVKSSVFIKPASMVAADLKNGSCDVALIPSLDLLKLEDVFVSDKFGISFDGLLSNSYLYFNKEQGSVINDLLLKGEVTTNEIILTPLLFAELFGQKVNVILDTQPEFKDDRNYIVSGLSNFDERHLFEKGASFSDFVNELINAPYVNFVFVSKNKEKLKEFNRLIKTPNEQLKAALLRVKKNTNLDDKVVGFIENNIDGLYFDLTEIEKSGLLELLKIPYYHGIIEDIIELNFIN